MSFVVETLASASAWSARTKRHSNRPCSRSSREVAADSGAVTLAPERRLGYLAQIIEGYDDQTLDVLIAESVAYLHELESFTCARSGGR
ncbi:MAG: hypothetical protein U0521_02715 [Anaerolineae bacterium]